MMKRREGKGAPSADLLVCFPTKYAHQLTLMPKPICSPAHQNDQSTRHHRQNSIKKKHINNRNRTTPILWPKTKPNNNNSDISSEPTSPKINCAGQIKVGPKPTSCKNWQSVMEEIERLHKQKKRGGWVEALGFKKDVMQFLACLRNIRFDFRCFGAFPNSEITSDDEEEEEEEDEKYGENSGMGLKEESESDNGSSMLSKWFMILEENTQTKDFLKTEERNRGKMILIDADDEEEDDDDGPCAPPPPNALLLMRCRSAPAKSWLEETEEEKNRKKVDEINQETKEKEAEKLIVMRSYGTEYSKLSCDIANETWIVGGIKDVLSRSRSCRR